MKDNNPYTSQWWYSDEGQRIARIMMEMIEHNGNGEKLFSNDYVVMVAKMAYEAGKHVGDEAGYEAGYEDCRQRIIGTI
jgi:hypothetical protein